MFFFKTHPYNETKRLVSDYFLLFKKALYQAKQLVGILVLIYFERTRLRHTIKTNYIIFHAVGPEKVLLDFNF